MRTLFILRGLPGSGKSTVAAELIRKEPKRFVRINRDDLRGMAVGPGNNPHVRDDNREDLMRVLKEQAVREAFKAGYDVILDDTHLVSMTVKKLHQLAASIGDVTVIEKGINIDVETCVKRDAARTGFAHVGEKVIRDMARGAGLEKGRKLNDKTNYYPPRWAPTGAEGTCAGFDPDSRLPKAIMCDLDGTLALIDGRSPYDATDCDVKDKPNWPVIQAVMAMHKQGVKVIFMSGRDVKYRPETVRFIEKYCVCNCEHCLGRHEDRLVALPAPIPYELHMRGELDLTQNDTRKDNIIKEELYVAHVAGKYNVLFVLDDRDQVVDQWRTMGLTCFQVAPGAF